ncbi:unnamed protein product [Lactuca virosa]|jgi:hypothetical protein
MESS